MAEEIDLNQQMSSNASALVNNSEKNDMMSKTCGVLDEVFGVIFNSSKQVLGNISSVGIRYGRSLKDPDHMLVLFADEVYGFQGWNDRKNKNIWCYQQKHQMLTKNGVQVQADESKSFIDFIQEGLAAIDNQSVDFSKNITKKEIKQLSR